ncbi:MAG: L-2-amino-thiazoline-4-carboxylic acid hydrolase [Clostridia bacterium]|nr:L-2-amino-thiazoline-4-carboxylic acid hydrolase [Clostridia bacterium]
MKYMRMPAGMWALFAAPFQRELKDTLGCSEAEAKRTAKAAKRRYRKLIDGLPDFEKGDRFQMNIVSCAMLCSFVLEMPQRPSVDALTDYYRNAMMTGPMRLFCRLSGKRKFTAKDVAGMRQTAAFRAADRNPYSWNMDFLPYPNGSGYEARFTKCGICTLMRELGLFEYVPAMCRLDYTMSEAGGVSDFVREYTLASGGPYCDCGYRKKESR